MTLFNLKKLKFLKQILKKANNSYDAAMKYDPQCITGEFTLTTHTESKFMVNGQYFTSMSKTSGGKLYTPIYHKLREIRNIHTNQNIN